MFRSPVKKISPMSATVGSAQLYFKLPPLLWKCVGTLVRKLYRSCKGISAQVNRAMLPKLK